MTNYTVEMFQADYDEVIPLVMQYRDLESLDEKKNEAQPQNAFLDIVGLFREKYGNLRGTDYQMRFLSIMQFIEHYSKDLLKDGLISENQKDATHIPSEVLTLLLESFRDPQPPSIYPSSSLHNSDHQFNYKKVLKSFRAGR